MEINWDFIETIAKAIVVVSWSQYIKSTLDYLNLGRL